MSVDVHRLGLKRELDQAQADWEAAPEWFKELPFLGRVAREATEREDLAESPSPQAIGQSAVEHA